MAATFDEVVRLADQFSPSEKQALIDHSQSARKRRKKRPSEILHVFHVDVWPENMTLRHEDEYGDDSR